MVKKKSKVERVFDAGDHEIRNVMGSGAGGGLRDDMYTGNEYIFRQKIPCALKEKNRSGKRTEDLCRKNVRERHAQTSRTLFR